MRRNVWGLVAALAFTACAVCCLWAIFVFVFANGMFAAGDSHPAESADLMTPLLLAGGCAALGVAALVKRAAP